MNRAIKQRQLQAAKELRRYFNGETYRADTPECAFIKWYIEARFGRVGGGDHVLSDGTGDGGIDSVVFRDGVAVVFQMKYETVPKLGIVRRDELAGFEKIARLLTDKNNNDAFNIWLNTVRPNLRATYRKLYAMPSDALRFTFVTSKYCELKSKTVDVEDIQKVLSLWSLYREGFTPPTESIKLALENTWYHKSSNGFGTYVGLADAQDFLRLMKDDKNERLFAQNVRTDLRSTINVEIRKTYEKSPDQFWLGNNGIYIVCRAVNSNGTRFDLTFPSIINGSQTLHAISASPKRHSCRILVRILEMDVFGNPKMLGEVIRRTNTQNAMKSINLMAHDPFQLYVAVFLDKYSIFYERRQREWVNEKKNILPGHVPISSKEVGQWLSTLDPAIGLGRARNNPSGLFQEGSYQKIFDAFDPEQRSPQYRDLAYTVWAGLLVKALIRKLPAKKKSQFKIPQLLLIKAVVASIQSDKGLQAAVRKALLEHKFGRKYLPLGIARELRAAVIKFVALQRRTQRRDANLDYSNFFKSDMHSAKAYQSAFTPMKIRSLARALASNVSQVS